ncbi:MAG: hypothetical protein P1U65_03885 [Minwuia sp.]|nr:hypothetical protein [Minwuia sp.]
MPFTTSSLAQSRVRLDDRGRQEVILPGFSGGKGVYITAWSSLPDITSPSVHDRALIETIAQQRVISPPDVRRCWAELATTGIGGQALAEKAREELAHAAEVRVATRIMLLLDCIRRSGGKVGPELMARLGHPDGEQQAKALLAGTARRIDCDVATIDAHIGELAALLGTLGLRSLPQPGRLRDLHVRLQEFSHAIGNWSRTTVSESAPVGHFAAMSSEHSAAIAGRAIAQVDALLADSLKLISNREAGKKSLRTELLRIAWLLDGWDYVLRVWADVVAERTAVDVAIAEIGRIVPIVPASEVQDASAHKSVELFRQYRSRVGHSEDWLSGDPDEADPAGPGPGNRDTRA